MPSTAIIPCWRKPNFLRATLRLIERAQGANRLRYLFSIDRDADPEVNEVIASFRFLSNSSTVRRNHKYPGNSFNILEALKSVAGPSHPNDLIYIIEDDIFVSTDFFDFHEDAHKLDEPFFVSACRGPRKLVYNIDAPAVYRNAEYRSHGVSFRAFRLADIVEHATRDYYKDMIGYCSKQLNDQGVKLSNVEQDGIIHRVVRRLGSWGIYPVKPRAFHAGVAGYNHGVHDLAVDSMTADQLLGATSDQLNALCDPEYRDIERCELIRARVSLRLV